MGKKRFLLFSQLTAWRLRRAARADMVASLYECPDREDRQRWDRYCAVLRELEEERAAWASFKGRLCLSSEEIPIDLLPGILARRAEAGARGRHWTARAFRPVALSLAMCVVVLAGWHYSSQQGNLSDVSPPDTAGLAQTEAAPFGESPLVAIVHQACRMVEESDVAGAVMLLEESVARHADDPLAGEAQLVLADLEYSYLHRYPEAFAAYDKLRSEYPDVFSSSPESIMRYDLLTEARRENFMSLYTLDVARNNRNGAFPMYERLMAQYPNSLLAAVVMDEMRMLVVPGLPSDSRSLAMGLEQVRERCSDPIAAAQVDLALGHLYGDTLRDEARARAHFRRAADSDHVGVAHQAREALARLD